VGVVGVVGGVGDGGVGPAMQMLGLNPPLSGVHLSTPSEYIPLQHPFMHWEFEEHCSQSPSDPVVGEVQGATSSFPYFAKYSITPRPTRIITGYPEESPTVACELSVIVCLEVRHYFYRGGGVHVRTGTTAITNAVAKNNL